MIWRHLLALAALWLIIWPALPARSELVNQVVAVVGQEIITLTDVDGRISMQLARLKNRYSGPRLTEELNQLRRLTLERMIDDLISEMEAERLGLRVTEKDIDKAVERVLKANRLSLPDLKASLARDGMTLEDYRRRVRTQILQSRLVYSQLKPKIFILEADKRALYEARSGEFKGGVEIVLHQIVLEAGDEEALRNIQDELSRQVSFVQLAQQYSVGPNAGEGGLLGRFELEQLSGEVRAVVIDLEAGQVSQPLTGDGGKIKLFQVAEKEVRPGLSFEEMEEELTQELTDKVIGEKFKEWVEGARRRHFVKIMELGD